MNSKNLKVLEKEVVENEMPSISDEMEEFLEDIQYVIDYAEQIIGTINFPESEKYRIRMLVQYARTAKMGYEYSLRNESADDLEDRQDEICDEMDDLSEQMSQSELELDRFMIYIQTEPAFKLQFKGIGMLVIGRSKEEC